MQKTLIAVDDAIELRTRTTFNALLQALSRPGTLMDLPPGDAMLLIGEALLDEETTFAALEEGVVERLASCGARYVPVPDAAYVFAHAVPFPVGDLLRDLAMGTLEFPDQSATLVVYADFTTGPRLRFDGPGAPPEGITPRIGGVPVSFWRVRNTCIQYPLGFDCLFVSNRKVMGVPRTTRVEVI